MNCSEGLTKGAWSAEEDNLLRKCIEIYGEEKWHLVPQRAGLNRCRKSCRLRWLNYLSPNIKRGSFSVDEVDLIVRMHKLLGNRWSMIAGRLPGRTANDLKNYWNTHLKTKKDTSSKKNKREELIQKVKAIRPQPQTLSKDFVWLNDISSNTDPDHTNIENTICEPNDISLNTNPHTNIENNICEPIMDTGVPLPDNNDVWWQSLLSENEIEQTPTGWAEVGVEEDNDYLSFDEDLWNFGNSTMH